MQFFEGTFKSLDEYRFQSTMFTGCDSLTKIPLEGGNRFSGAWFGKLSVPLPANMVQGIDTQRLDFENGLPSYLRGRWAKHGWWYYYLYALAIKVPLGTWCLVLLAIGLTFFSRGYSASWRDEMVVLVPGLVILIFISSQTGFSAHSRYIIPALPFLFVWTSKAGRVFEMRPFNKMRLAMVVAVIASLTWSVGSSLSIYPHSLSYFNELAIVLPTPADASYPKPIEKNENNGILSFIDIAISGGPRNGPRHLLDSNIDWGQDLFYLKKWLDQHPEIILDGLAVWGSYPATLAGIPATSFPLTAPVEISEISKAEGDCATVGPAPGWYALSVNYIYDSDRQYRYFLNFQPVAMVGYSIYIYHITTDEANSVRKDYGLPEIGLDTQNDADKSRS